MKHVSKSTATNEKRNMRKEFAPAPQSRRPLINSEEASTACLQL